MKLSWRSIRGFIQASNVIEIGETKANSESEKGKLQECVLNESEDVIFKISQDKQRKSSQMFNQPEAEEIDAEKLEKLEKGAEASTEEIEKMEGELREVYGTMTRDLAQFLNYDDLDMSGYLNELNEAS